jgi:hypothetical protein
LFGSSEYIIRKLSKYVSLMKLRCNYRTTTNQLVIGTV